MAVGKPAGHFIKAEMGAGGEPTVHSAIAELMALMTLDSIRMQAEQAVRNKPVSSPPSWPRYEPVSEVPAPTSFRDGRGCGNMSPLYQLWAPLTS